MKLCVHCKIEKPTIDYNRESKRKDGLCLHCKSCAAKKRKRLRETNRDQYIRVGRIRYVRNKEKIKLYSRNYVAKNREIVNQKKRESYHANIEENRKRQAAYKRKHRKKFQELQNAYYRKNPTAKRAIRLRRSLREKLSGVPVLKKHIDRCISEQHKKCAICFSVFTNGFQIDHIHPLAKGGLHHPHNIQLLCASCNRDKSDKDWFLFLKERGIFCAEHLR